MLNNNQLIAVQLVAQGKTGKFISEHLNVAQETISRWRKKIRGFYGHKPLRDNNVNKTQ